MVNVISSQGLTPQAFGEWRDWATALLNRLTKPEERTIVRLPLYTHARKPRPAEDGFIIMVLDDSQGKIPIYSANEDWFRFDGTFAEPPVEVAMPESSLEFTTGTWVITVA